MVLQDVNTRKKNEDKTSATARSCSTRVLFDTFSPIIHTKTPKNADENGDFRRRLKTHRFENAPFLVWTGENGDVKSVTCRRFQSKSEHLSKMEDG